MRNVFFALIVMSMLFVSCDSGKKYTLQGDLTGMTEGKVYLNELNKRDLVKIDSAEIKDGKFSFAGTIQSPDMRYITIDGQKGGIQFFIEGAEIHIKADVSDLRKAEITGSATQEVYQEYAKMQGANNQEFRSLQGAYQKAAAEKNQAAMDSVEKQYDAIVAKIMKENVEYVKKNSTSVAAAFIGYRLTYEMETVEEMDTMYIGFADNVKKSSYAIKIKEKIDVLKNSAVGKPAPEIALNTPEDKPFKLSSLKGKVVVIDFWASWCGPCRRENPHMVEIYKEFHDKGVEFLGVSLDKKKESWLKAIKDDGLIWNHVSDLKYWDCAAAKLYGVSSVPSTVVVDQNGVIAAKKVFGDDLKAEIEKLLK